MRGYKNLKEIKRECVKVKSCASDSDGFMYKCFPLLIKQLIEINQKIGKKRRPATEYQLKVGKYMKEGKTMQEAHKLAKE